MPFPIESKYIDLAEQEIGLMFPDEFKTKMIEENEGEISTREDHWELISFFDKSSNKRISRTCNHISKETAKMKEWANFPKNGVAIAFNGFGDCLLLLPSITNQRQLGEEIMWWDHETGEMNKVSESINGVK